MLNMSLPLTTHPSSWAKHPDKRTLESTYNIPAVIPSPVPTPFIGIEHAKSVVVAAWHGLIPTPEALS